MFSLNLEESFRPFEDAVSDFNSKNYTSSELASLTPISGAFYKCRSKGGASSMDLEKNNVFYKRCLATFSLLMVNTYFLVTICYDSKIINPKSGVWYRAIPAIVYPGAILGFCGFVFMKSSEMNKELDRKYTPMWKHILETQKNAKVGQE